MPRLIRSLKCLWPMLPNHPRGVDFSNRNRAWLLVRQQESPCRRGGVCGATLLSRNYYGQSDPRTPPWPILEPEKTMNATVTRLNARFAEAKAPYTVEYRDGRYFFFHESPTGRFTRYQVNVFGRSNCREAAKGVTALIREWKANISRLQTEGLPET